MRNVKDLKEGQVILCTTLEEYHNISRILHHAGLKYWLGDSYTDVNFYNEFPGDFAFRPCTGTYHSASYYKNEWNMEILPASDFYAPDIPITDVKAMIDKNVYAVVNSTGGEYTTHGKAAQYGMANYHHWLNKRGLTQGDVLKVINTVRVNAECSDSEDCYILEDTESIQYLIATRCCTKINFR